MLGNTFRAAGTQIETDSVYVVLSVLTKERQLTELSWLLFDIIAADTEWMAEDPERWLVIEEYSHQRDFCRDLQVVNDCAERKREVKDVQDYGTVT